MKYMDFDGRILVNSLNDVSEFPSVFKKYKNSEVELGYSVTVTVFNGYRFYPVTIIVKNNEGLKNLYKIMTIIKTENYKRFDEQVITKEELSDLSNGLLIGAGIINGELDKYEKLSDKEIMDMAMFYDFIIIDSLDDVDYLSRVVNLLDKNKKLVVYFLDMEETSEGFKYLNTSMDAAKALNFLSGDVISNILNLNIELLSDLVSDVDIIKTEKCFPRINNSKEELRNKVYSCAYELYGKDLPKNIRARIEDELSLIFVNNNEVPFIITKILVDYSKKLGYDVISRGGVGSSLVCFILGLTKVDPLKYDLDYLKFLDKDNIQLNINYASEVYDKIKEKLEGLFPDHVFNIGVKCERNGKKVLCRHVSSIVIIPDDKDVSDFTALAYTMDNPKFGEVTTFDHKELNNLMIMNILGHSLPSMIKNLKDMSNIDFDNIDYENKEVYDLFCSGDTNDIFGFESDAAKDILKKAKPRDFEKLVDVFITIRDGGSIDRAHFISLLLEMYKLVYAKIYDTSSFKKCIEIENAV